MSGCALDCCILPTYLILVSQGCKSCLFLFLTPLLKREGAEYGAIVLLGAEPALSLGTREDHALPATACRHRMHSDSCQSLQGTSIK